MTKYKTDNILIRYKTIDKCLSDYSRKWNINDLMWECSKAISEFKGFRTIVCKKSIETDIRDLRNLFNAEITISKSNYSYKDKDFNIKNLQIPINPNSYKKIKKAVILLRHFKDYSFLDDVRILMEEKQT